MDVNSDKLWLKKADAFQWGGYCNIDLVVRTLTNSSELLRIRQNDLRVQTFFFFIRPATVFMRPKPILAYHFVSSFYFKF